MLGIATGHSGGLSHFMDIWDEYSFIKATNSLREFMCYDHTRGS